MALTVKCACCTVAVKLQQVRFKVKRVIIMSLTLFSVCFQGVKGDCESCIQNWLWSNSFLFC